MSTTIGHITFGEITNVRKSGNEEDVYFVDINISSAPGFPFENHIYCARGDDYAETGKWVFQQIKDGNFTGEITQLLRNADPVTGLVPDISEIPPQPTTQGAQIL